MPRKPPAKPEPAPSPAPPARTNPAGKTTVRLSDEDRRILGELAERHGLDATAAIRLAIRALHGAVITLPKIPGSPLDS